jgi:hypothetical protein
MAKCLPYSPERHWTQEVAQFEFCSGLGRLCTKHRLRKKLSDTVIPNIVHFIFFNEPPRPQPFALYHFLAIESALRWLRPSSLRFYTSNAPYGPFWERLQGRIEVVHVERPIQVFGRPLGHYAHQADVTRLDVLIEYGGIYLDLDTIVRRSFAPLLNHRAVMGLQKNPDGSCGLCNAVILSEARHPFLLEWRQTYQTFRSSGMDEFWDEHSVRIPLELAGVGPFGDRRQQRSDIEILPAEGFFEPSYWPYDLKRLFERVEHFENSFAHHLWASFSADRYLDRLTPDIIRSVDTTYNLLARPLLPDTIGADVCR